MFSVRNLWHLYVAISLVFSASPAFAQQTGSIRGRVIDSGGGLLPGVTVEARSNVLPTPRVTTTEANGEYRLPALPPGDYTLTFTLSGMQAVTRQAQVQLAAGHGRGARRSASAAVTETVDVVATATLVDRDSATLKSGVSNEQIMALPVGQEYRDLRQADSGRAVHAGPDRAARAPAAAARTTSISSTAST